ncbi:MAG: sigma 54-interacting transcriptional regulator [Deltaproteobacteria bacterium]|nr:sigma 54-interacting transcriptional regulator [Deltaproteobacteria bacterium]
MSFTRTIPILPRSAEGRALHLLVMGPDAFETHALPPEGLVVIGRDPEAQVVLLDPQSSRRHAQIHISATLFEIEDLGSFNGTWVREEKLKPHTRMRIWPGEGFRIGNLMLMLQRHRPRLEARRVWPHGHFEALLAYQCERSRMAGGALAVARIRVDEPITPARFAATVATSLQPADLLALYAANDFEILMVGRSPESARTSVEHMAKALKDEDFTVRTAVASHPQDGRDPEALMAALRDRMLGVQRLNLAGERVIVDSDAMRTAYNIAMRAAASSINVLILGETGSGKEVLARAIHRSSPRAKAPMVTLNCAALPETLMESELFGHERGAFTSADSSKVGLLASAPGGTIFLDEVGEMPLSTQAKLLRAIEEKEVVPVGAVKPIPIDVRFIAATNRGLEDEVKTGGFRPDLFFRLNGITITLPPLRERVAEIQPFARLFLAQACTDMGRKENMQFSPPAMEWMQRYPWPGNVRELRNVIERAVVLCEGDAIGLEHLPVERMRDIDVSSESIDILSIPEAERKDRIVKALDSFAGNQTRTAGFLGISRKTLLTLLDRYGIARPRKR